MNRHNTNNSRSSSTQGQAVPSKLVPLFATLFRGRSDAWGIISGGCIKRPVMINHYHRHLAGKVSLGIYPLRQDGRCRWFAIDIDHDDPRRAIAIIERLVAIGFNRGIYLERSKSKGYHVLAFLSDWVPAQDVRRVARHAIREAGLPASTEVFPKQDTTDNVHYGNYLNLPYFGGSNVEGRRMIAGLETLRPIPLDEWLQAVEVFPVRALPLVLESLPEAETNQNLGHTPEEILNMVEQPLVVGERRPTLVKLAGYLRYRGIPEEVAVALTPIPLKPWLRRPHVCQHQLILQMCLGHRPGHKLSQKSGHMVTTSVISLVKWRSKVRSDNWSNA